MGELFSQSSIGFGGKGFIGTVPAAVVTYTLLAYGEDQQTANVILAIGFDGGAALTQNAFGTVSATPDGVAQLTLAASAADLFYLQSSTEAVWQWSSAGPGSGYKAGQVSPLTFVGSPGWRTLSCTWGNLPGGWAGYDNGTWSGSVPGFPVGVVSNGGILAP